MDSLAYGVSRLAVIAVRKEPDDRAEQTTQLLFGDHYELLSYTKDSKWSHIRVFADGYEGWIDAKQHHEITKEYFDQINHANFKITTDIASGILYKKNPITILLGSIVPISNSELFKMEEQFAFNGEAKSLGQKRDYEFLKEIAIKYLHAPYQWGGKSPFGIDCSGFTQMVFKINGYPIPRDSTQQQNAGKEVGSLDQALPGDLAFFTNGAEVVSHVGIVMENEKIVHASGQVRIDHLSPDGIIHSESNAVTHVLKSIRRILTH